MFGKVQLYARLANIADCMSETPQANEVHENKELAGTACLAANRVQRAQISSRASSTVSAISCGCSR